MPKPVRGAELDELRAFEAVARLGTVAAAARELFRTQPSISARIASLESSWSTRLFDRRPRGMALTPEGRHLLGRAQAVLEAAAALDRDAGLPVAEDSTVRLGSGDALSRALVPRALKRLLAERPGVRVRVREGSATRLEAELREGAIDVALLTAAPSGSGLHRRALLSSPVELLVPSGRKLPRRALRPEDLAGEALVLLLPGSSFRRFLEETWRERGLVLSAAVEVGSYSLVRRFVAAGLGPAPVPAVAFAGEGERGGLVEVRKMPGLSASAWDVVVRDGAPLTSGAARLIELLIESSRSRPFA